jgi:hypothetical protein
MHTQPGQSKTTEATALALCLYTVALVSRHFSVSMRCSECRTKRWVDRHFRDGKLICIICRDVRTVLCNNDCKAQGIPETHDAREHRAELPGKPDRLALVSFGPEQVEKEPRSKYRCNIDADEDVVGGHADKVIVVNSGGIV